MSGTVLIVDDSLTVRMDLAEAFEAAGFHPITCATLAEARTALASGPVALAVLDVLLPDGDGIALLAELRASPATAETVVLMLSSEAEVEDRLRGLQTGADEYVGKPYDKSYVVARAGELLQRRQADVIPDRTLVLLIDDSATFREELGRALELGGYTVLMAATGEEGLHLAAGSRPEAVIVDGVLPGIDGATVVRRMRLDAALRHTPCLLLTASSDRGAELQALDAGADAFVRKGEDLGMILARLGAVLRTATAGVGSEKTASLLAPKRILAVDDSETFLQELGLALRGEGYDTVLVRSGEAALEMLAVQPVDCILLDLLMPGLGGKETCLRIKSAPVVRDIPLIILTAVSEREAMIEGLSTGADDYISKSSDFEVLKARVRAQIRRRQFEDENRRIREELLHRELEATEARAARELAETRAALVGELERKNKELEAFSYSVSHDLRAPLRSIDGFSQALLEDYMERLDDKGKDYLRRVRTAAQRMSELIDDLLQLSRLGRAELKRERIDLADIAHLIAADLRKNDPRRQATILVEEGLWAEADSRLIRVALENLLGNAWKFTAQVEAPKIELGTTPGGEAFFVRDNGAGFDMAYVGKLFGPFQRLHAEAEFPGTGIGLAIVQRIIDRHGGRVWAEGEAGRGATFYFTIPPVDEGGPD
ncbi:MAG TPA: response regulator [Thermoanaerobaculia bacterium]|jgi:DNA-binding response OmpR family regulator|nr:response regulator [Thermoanaerobaculia bacterium]